METSRQSQFDPQIPMELHRRASQIARQAQRLYWVRAGLLWLAISITLSLVFIAIDYGLHVDESGLRWLLSLLWIGLLLAAAIWLFGSALAFRLSAVQLAHWVERASPQYRGRLSAALAILELPSGDQRYGSQALRAVALSRLDVAELHSAWDRALSFRSLGLCASGLAASLLGLACMVFYQPQQAYLGLERLVQPWAAMPWPRVDELQFVDLPKVIATGSELPIVVVDRKPPLPESVSLQVRYPIGEGAAISPAESTQAMREIPLQLASEAAIGTWSETQRSFEMRAVGGDDRNSAWHKVQVAELPQLTDSRFQVQPPAYSRQPSAELVGQRIEVLAGTRVTFTGTYSEQVLAVQAQLHSSREEVDAADIRPAGGQLASPARQASAGHETVAAAIAGDGRAFRLLADDASGRVMTGDLQWQLRVTTQAGLEMTDPTRWSIHVVPDRPPVVTLLPADPPWLTPGSRMLISGQASDDLELVEIELKWQLQGANEANWQTRRLWSSLEPNQSLEVEIAAKVVDAMAMRSMNLSYAWSLAAEQLPVGATLTYVLEARDSLGQVSRSVPQTLQIQDARSVLAQAEQEQARIQTPLEQLAQSQRRNAEAIEKLSDIVHQTSQMDAQQLETLSAARQLQQSIGQKLSESSGSVLKKLKVLETQLERSGLGTSELAAQLQDRITDLEALNSRALSPADQELAAAESLWRGMLQSAPTVRATEAALAQADATTSRQRQAADQLASLVREVAAATTTADLHRQVAELATRQREIQSATEQLQMERLAGSNAPQQQAKQLGLRADEQHLARALDEVGARMDQLLEQSATAMDRDTANLKRLRQAMLDQQIGQQIRDAADALQADKLSEAIRHQQTAAQALEQAASQFGSGDSGQLADQSSNLAQLASALGELANRQSDLGNQIEELATRQDVSAATQVEQQQSLAGEQSRVLQQLQELAQQAEVRSNQSLDQLVQSALEAGRAAQSQLQNKQFDQAEANQRESAEQLEQAEQLTQRRAQSLEQQVAQQQLYDLRAVLEEMVRQQQGNVERLERLAGELPDERATQAGWEKSVAQATASQQATSQNLERALDQASAVETFAWVLTRAQSDMQRAVAALQRRRVNPDAIVSANDALRKLQAVAMASQEAASQATESAEAAANPTDDAAAQNADKSQRQGPVLASLRLIREMQAELREQTMALNGQSTPEAQTLLLRLAEEQTALAEQTRKLMQLMVE